MKVLITGIAGFIGKWLAEQLISEKYEVVGLDLKAGNFSGSVRVHEVDLLDRDRLTKILVDESPDMVVHLAAVTDIEHDDLEHYAANIQGVENLFDAVRATPSTRRVLITSSQLVCEVGYVPKSETDYKPSTSYGRSKILTEEITRRNDGGGVEWCILRPTTVWGPGMSPHYQSMLRYIASGKYFHSGSSKLKKSYGYARNVAFQYARFLKAPAERIHGKVFYVADYEPLSLRDYINTLADELGVRRPITLPLWFARALAFLGDCLCLGGLRFPFTSFRLKNILTEYVFDMSGTEQICGSLPTTFAQGVKETATWFQSLE